MSTRIRKVMMTVVAVAATAAVVLPTSAAALPSGAPSLPSAAAGAGGRTHVLDHAAYLQGVNDPQWFEDNIPFVDLPDDAASQQIQDVYYYRWRAYKEHLRYTDTDDGWVTTEFLDCCSYAAPYQAINAAAGHHLSEGRWLRDPTYGDDLVDFWLTGPGSGPKPATDDVNADTTDWAHEYSFWLASAALGRAEVTGDTAQLEQLLPQLVQQYRGWDGQFDPSLGLYWSVPVWDAMEFSASSYESDEPYHGGAGFRPTLNSYQAGDATAISRIAALAGDTALSREYADRAAALTTSMQQWLWDPDRQFFYAMPRDDNPDHHLSGTREEIGFLPWTFGAASASAVPAWSQLLDPQGFAAPYGPTTAERRSPLFLHEADQCCRWDGPSWPFATSQTLTGLANLLDGPDAAAAQSVITRDDYSAALATYARTQMKNGKPYVAEAHSPDDDSWIYDGQNHSEDYNHSTYDDLVLGGLLGIRPQLGRTVQIQPLTPASWDHFAVEGVSYHGHDLTYLWDADGTHYSRGKGMRVWVDGRLVRQSPILTAVTVDVGPTVAPRTGPRQVNDAANPLRTGYPQPISSYTWRGDDAWNAIDGKVWYDEVPENTRWTNYSSPNPRDWLGVDFGTATPVDHVRFYGYDDGGGVRPAAGYRVQYLDGARWRDVPGQRHSPQAPIGNGPNDITFPGLTTSALRVLFTNPAGAFVGVSELQAWSTSSSTLRLSTHAVGTDGPPVVGGPTTVAVDAANTSRSDVTSVVPSLVVPQGWSARLLSPSITARVRPGATASWRYRLTPPAATTPGSTVALLASAAYRRDGAAETTHHRGTAQVAFPPGQHDPIAAWALDEASGTTAADAAGDHPLTLQGGASWTAADGGTALALDGSTGAAVSSPTAGAVVDTVGSYSVSARVRLDATGRFATAASQDGDGTSGFYLQYSQADDRFAFATSTGRALSDSPPVVGRWTTLVGVHDADARTFTLYVDGVAQSTVLSGQSGSPSTGPFAVGRAQSGGGPADFWPGAIRQVTVWDRALTAAEAAGSAD